jgi:hypothetical protein
MRQQIIRIILGFLAAELVTTVLISVYFKYLIQFIGTTRRGISIYDFIDFNAFQVMAYYVIMFASLPFAIFIFLTERYNWRSFLIYFALGALLPSLMIAIASPYFRFSSEGFKFMVVLGGIGVAACLTYWAIAGCHAGLWKRQEP